MNGRNFCLRSTFVLSDCILSHLLCRSLALKPTNSPGMNIHILLKD